MIETLTQFFYMHGYGVYVFSAYAAVFGLLASIWLMTFTKWRCYLKRHKQYE